MNRAVESCKKLLLFLDQIEETGNLDAGHLSVLKEDKENIHLVLEIIETANSKEQIREAWSLVNDMKHYFGGYVGGAVGMRLHDLFNEVWRNVLNLL